MPTSSVKVGKSPGVPWKAGVHYFLLSSIDGSHPGEVSSSSARTPKGAIITDIFDIPLSKLPHANFSSSTEILLDGSLKAKGHAKHCENLSRNNAKIHMDPEERVSEGEVSLLRISEGMENQLPKLLPRKRPRTLCTPLGNTVHQEGINDSTRENSPFPSSLDNGGLRSSVEDSTGLHFSCIIGRQSLCLKSTLGEDRTISRALFKLSLPNEIKNGGSLPINRFLCKKCSKVVEYNTRTNEEEAVGNIIRVKSSITSVNTSCDSVFSSDACRSRRGPLSLAHPVHGFLNTEGPAVLPTKLVRAHPDRNLCTASTPGAVCSSSLPSTKLQLPPLELEVLSSTHYMSIIDRRGTIKAPVLCTACEKNKHLSAPTPITSKTSSATTLDCTSPSISGGDDDDSHADVGTCLKRQTTMVKNTFGVPNTITDNSAFPFSPYFSCSRFTYASAHAKVFNPEHSLFSGYRTWLNVGDVILIKGVRLEVCAFVWIHERDDNQDSNTILKEKKGATASAGFLYPGLKPSSTVSPKVINRYTGIYQEKGKGTQQEDLTLPLLCSSPHLLYGFPFSNFPKFSLCKGCDENTSGNADTVLLPLLPFFRMEWLEMSKWTQHQLLVHYWNAWSAATSPFVDSMDSPPVEGEHFKSTLENRNVEKQKVTMISGTLQQRPVLLSPCGSPSASRTVSDSECGSPILGNASHTDAQNRGVGVTDENDLLCDEKQALYSIPKRSRKGVQSDSEEDAATPSSQWGSDELSLPASKHHLAFRLPSSSRKPSLHEEEVRIDSLKAAEDITILPGTSTTTLKTMERKHNRSDKEREGAGISLLRDPCSTPPPFLQPPLTSSLPPCNVLRYGSFARVCSTGRESLSDATSLFHQQLDELLGEVNSNSQDNTPMRINRGSGVGPGISRTSTNVGEGDYTLGSQQQISCDLSGGLEYPEKIIQESVDVCYYD